MFERGTIYLAEKKAQLQGSVDSFVVETNVDYPTDAKLLWDCMRNAILPTSRLCEKMGLPGWRKEKYICKKFKHKIKTITKSKRSRSNDREARIEAAYKSLLDYSKNFIDRINVSLEQMSLITNDLLELSQAEAVRGWIAQAEKQISQIQRRVFDGETIPHEEKIFSVFEPHTRWISKGKAGVLVELGLPVSIFKDQHGFILGYHVMKTENDVDVCVPFTRKVAGQFPALLSVSYDKGYWSPKNMEDLSQIIELPVLPKKGRLSSKDRERQQNPNFIRRRKAHPAVESAINGLEHSGLDRCPDRTLIGFERYVGLAALARNLQTLGCVILEKEKKKKSKEEAKKGSVNQQILTKHWITSPKSVVTACF